MPWDDFDNVAIYDFDAWQLIYEGRLVFRALTMEWMLNKTLLLAMTPAIT